jgi:hypothetical protein
MEELKLALQVQGNELNIRTGELEAPYVPGQLSERGNIDAPGVFYKARREWVDSIAGKSYVKIEQNKSDSAPLKVILVCGETDQTKIEISGTLTFDKYYKEFGINNPNKKYTVQSLLKQLKNSRAFFLAPEVHAGMVNALKNFEARTTIEFQNTNDFKGQTAFKKIENCKTSIDYVFDLYMPIYTGQPKTRMTVEIEFEPDNGSIVCWLVSQDAREFEDFHQSKTCHPGRLTTILVTYNHPL